MINTAYDYGEGNMWLPGFKRTNPAEIVLLLASGHLLVARQQTGELSADGQDLHSTNSQATGTILPDTASGVGGRFPVYPQPQAIAGCIKLEIHAADGAAELGMLAVAETGRRHGIGAALMQAAETRARAAECTRLQLQLLHPRNGTHPVKEFLKQWYAARGFRIIGNLDFSEHCGDKAALLAGPVHFDLYEKTL